MWQQKLLLQKVFHWTVWTSSSHHRRLRIHRLNANLMHIQAPGPLSSIESFRRADMSLVENPWFCTLGQDILYNNRRSYEPGRLLWPTARTPVHNSSSLSLTVKYIQCIREIQLSLQGSYTETPEWRLLWSHRHFPESLDWHCKSFRRVMLQLLNAR